MRLLAAWALCAVAFVGPDFLWLSRMGDSFYRPMMGPEALTGFRAAPALLFYLIYTAGLTAFAVRPSLAGKGGWRAGVLRGAGLGLVAYATYDLTNEATLKVWPAALSLVDMAWGAFASGVAAGAAALVIPLFQRR